MIRLEYGNTITSKFCEEDVYIQAGGKNNVLPETSIKEIP